MKNFKLDQNNNPRVLYSILYVIMMAILSLGGSYLIALLGMSLGISDMQKAALLANFCMGTLGLAAIIFLTIRFFKTTHLNNIEILDYLSKKGISKFLLGIIPGTAMIVLISISDYFLTDYTSKYLGSSIEWATIICGVIAYLGMAVFEECAFRGVLQSVLLKVGKLASLLIPAILFPLCHMQLWQEFSVLSLTEFFLAGLLFGIVLITTRSLAFATGMHWAYNSTQILSGSIFEKNIYRNVFGCSMEQYDSIITIVVLMIAIAVFVLAGQRMQRK